ncbi:MAG: DUF3303 family protein [Candidatus Bathyarchaeia archaeon]
MFKFFVRWRMSPNESFKSPEERGKFVMIMLDEVKSEMEATGGLKDFGVCVDGSGGYCVYEVTKEADVFDSLHKWMSHVDFDVRRVLTAQQQIDARKGPQPSAVSQVARR